MAIMMRYPRSFRYRTEPGPTMQQWHEAMDLIDELVQANEALNARLFTQAQERDHLMEQVDAAVRVCAFLQQKVDQLRGETQP